jgi:hypothetical protein
MISMHEQRGMTAHSMISMLERGMTGHKKLCWDMCVRRHV